MTKEDLVKEVYKENGLSRGEASDIVELILDTLKTTLAEGETIKIAGFGTFTGCPLLHYSNLKPLVFLTFFYT